MTALDRQGLLRQAEQHARDGRFDAAAGVYARMIHDQPNDYAARNALGDLYVRMGDVARAVDQFTRVADLLFNDGFTAKAGAVYKKLLKLKTDDQHALLRLMDITAQQGLGAESKLYRNQVTSADDARDATAVPRTAEPAGSNADVLLAQAQFELADGAQMAARVTLMRLLAVAPDRHPAIVAMVNALIAADRIEDAYQCLEVAVDAALLDSAFDRAATLLQDFVEQRRYPPALERLIAVCAEAGFDDRRRLAEAERELLTAFAPEPEAEPPLVTVTVLAPDMTGAADEAPPRALEDVFDGLRAAAAQRTADPDEAFAAALQHLDAGRVEEAAASFQAAAREPRLRCRASAHLARLRREQGRLHEAVDWFERAADAPAASADESSTVLYDLADTLDRVGEPARALAVFLELQAGAAAFADVADRIDRLSRAGGPPA